MSKLIVLVSVSGGKDSQSTLNFILRKCKRVPVVAYFADTGWEAPETYEHIKYLEKTLNIKIHIVKSKKYDGFEDMCIKRGFPSRVRRFCTEELKIIPSQEFIKSYQDMGYTVINVTGVRADESESKKLKEPKIKNGVKWWITPKRSCENEWKFSYFYPYTKKIIKQKLGVLTYQPIIRWTAKEVLLYNLKCGTKNNPLYAKGYERVGCYPCIMCNVGEISKISRERADVVDALEKKVQKARGHFTVFYYKGAGELKGFKSLSEKYKYKHNGLDLDFGCINQFGICE